MEANKLSKPVASFGGSFSHGWDAMIKYFLILLLVVIALGFIAAPSGFGHLNFNMGDWGEMEWEDQFFDFGPNIAVLGAVALVIGIFALAYNLLVVPVFEFGGDMMFVHAARDVRPDFETLIKGFKENYLHIVLANVLKSALVMLGFIFLIIPGIIVACRLAFVSYLVMDKKRDPIVAIEESWKMTRGYGWTIFAMGFVSIFIFIAGFIMLFVGTIPAIMWVKSAFASLYQAVLLENEPEMAIEE